MQSPCKFPQPILIVEVHTEYRVLILPSLLLAHRITCLNAIFYDYTIFLSTIQKTSQQKSVTGENAHDRQLVFLTETVLLLRLCTFFAGKELPSQFHDSHTIQIFPLHALPIYGIIIAYSCIVLAFHRTQAAFDKVSLCASFAPPKGEGDAEG